MLPKGRYLEKCGEPLPQSVLFPDMPEPPEPPEVFKLYDSQRNPLHYITGEDLRRCKLWRVIIKDNELAYKKRINRYKISRRKIISLRKNTTIKRTYKRLLSEKVI